MAKLAGTIVCCYWIIVVASSSPAIGVNWGTFESVKLDPRAVVEMLEANGIGRVKLFDADPAVVGAFRNSKIELTVALPNEMLRLVGSLPAAARNWVRRNVTRYIRENVNIKYVAIGNEPFLKSYNGSYQSYTYPALINIQNALRGGDEGTRAVKATIPMNADVLAETVPMIPSGGAFRTDVAAEMSRIAAALADHASPFTINIYPFLSLAQDPFFPKEFAFLDGAAPPLVDGDRSYSNAFAAAYDTLAAALARIGFPDMAIVVGEIGWPTEGHPDATATNAQRFNQRLVDHILDGAGTPMRAGPMEIFLFALLDEDQKPIAAGNFERHWGILASDGAAKYTLNLTVLGGTNSNSNSNLNSSRPAMAMDGVRVRRLPSKWCVLNPDADVTLVGQNMEYACSFADCTPLMYGGSCNEIGGDGNASFAFNSYFQINQQERHSCHFDGLGTITKVDPSLGSCVFRIGIQSAATRRSQSWITAVALIFPLFSSQILTSLP
ncbi:hypothetical protein SELMODRAFT_236210 [Selaginella moellendorffii]|uniref:X8 domain-containing protein n=1 Tax=Selaginella moellendorffii TaxID=88036 RepID=D8T6C1_SELML|nr:glucan endo-1,3-beta-glucosidase 8 [Selaginella moellendorffii]EFJ07773.1 hypothetical protein SELMODRAFT_236210 [Selaginella moellendorffii]|eukprot:XP_002991127.1 glucan endo-1,3-beta-glucosidase 8 [Selaginella moellendorffii]